MACQRRLKGINARLTAIGCNDDMAVGFQNVTKHFKQQRVVVYHQQAQARQHGNQTG